MWEFSKCRRCWRTETRLSPGDDIKMRPPAIRRAVTHESRKATCTLTAQKFNLESCSPYHRRKLILELEVVKRDWHSSFPALPSRTFQSLREQLTLLLDNRVFPVSCIILKQCFPKCGLTLNDNLWGVAKRSAL